MSWIPSKPVTELTREDLDDVIDVEESDRLDFKEEAYKHTDKDTREMLRDISSFANAGGGHLLLGVKEGGKSRASEIVGIENGDQEASRMISQCRTCIAEQIIGLNFHLVPVGEGRDVLVWHIPRSTRKPHMITHDGLYQCWIRHGCQKDRMSIEEIREACLRTENVRRSLEDFIAERRDRVLREVYSNAFLYLTATPLVVRDEVIEIHDEAIREIMWRPPERDGDWTVDCGDEGPPRVKPSLYGLWVETNGWRRLELFRNAHAEFRAGIGTDFFEGDYKDTGGTRHNVLGARRLAEYTFSFLHFAKAIYNHVGLMEPVVVGLRLLNVKGMALRRVHPDDPFPRRAEECAVWNSEPHLELPLTQSPYPLSPEQVTKQLADRLWNAFGFESCPVLDAQGNLKLSLRRKGPGATAGPNEGRQE